MAKKRTIIKSKAIIILIEVALKYLYEDTPQDPESRVMDLKRIEESINELLRGLKSADEHDSEIELLVKEPELALIYYAFFKSLDWDLEAIEDIMCIDHEGGIVVGHF